MELCRAGYHWEKQQWCIPLICSAHQRGNFYRGLVTAQTVARLKRAGGARVSWLLQHLFSQSESSFGRAVFQEALSIILSIKRCAWHALAWTEHVSIQCWENGMKIFTVLCRVSWQLCQAAVERSVRPVSSAAPGVQLVCLQSCSCFAAARSLYFSVISDVVGRGTGVEFRILQGVFGLLAL